MVSSRFNWYSCSEIHHTFFYSLCLFEFSSALFPSAPVFLCILIINHVKKLRPIPEKRERSGERGREAKKKSVPQIHWRRCSLRENRHNLLNKQQCTPLWQLASANWCYAKSSHRLTCHRAPCSEPVQTLCEPLLDVVKEFVASQSFICNVRLLK